VKAVKVLDPADTAETLTRPTKSLTGLPETSCTETTGCVPKLVLLTAPDAPVVSTNLVAVPWFKVMFLVSVIETGLPTATVKVLVPARPVIERPLNETIPDAALLRSVPVSVASAMLSSTSGVPVVIKLPSKSLISISIEDGSVRALLALTGEEIVR
jgi:hypothetical protein